MKDGDDLDSIWEDDVVDNVPESLDPGGSNVLPNDTIQCGHGLDALEHLAKPSGELFSQTGSRLPQCVASALNIHLSARSENNG